MHAHIYTVHTHIMANSDQFWPILINFGQSVLRLLGGNSSKELATFTQLDKAKGRNLGKGADNQNGNLRWYLP